MKFYIHTYDSIIQNNGFVLIFEKYKVFIYRLLFITKRSNLQTWELKY